MVKARARHDPTGDGTRRAGLEEYRRKRDFAQTSEPRGEPQRGARGFSFVVQKHAARRLHYDFRLELDGVLKSWAVPKGPSLDPSEKRLAVQTEDHPLEYGDFEGVIPAGEYGGGTVLVWDRGTWMPVGDPRRGLASGKLKFRVQGEKLAGGWTLIKLRGRAAADGKQNWLLIKERDEAARSADEYDVTAERPESVQNGRGVASVARARKRTWRSKTEGSSRNRKPPGARRGALPRFVEPQLATLVAEPPKGDEWLHEQKFDGYRILCRIERGEVGLWSRNGKEWTARFPEIASAAAALPVQAALLDGEVAVLLSDGTTSFAALQNATSEGSGGEIVYFVFDVLHRDGYDLRGAALEARKRELQSLLSAAEGTPLRYSDHVVGNGEEFFRHACRLSLEGIVSKKRAAAYESGRSRSWLKVKCVQAQEFVIGGFSEPQGRRKGIGALLIGVHDQGGKLRYAGKVGTGFTDERAQELRARLEQIEVEACPFESRPRAGRGVHWVKPELVAEIEFTEWTKDARLRHPSFKGLREDKAAVGIIRERPRPQGPETGGGASKRKAVPVAQAAAANAEASVAGVRLTHPDRVLYPAQGLTKRALALFYESIAEWILPDLRDRPTTLLRCPEGLRKECFYQKHVPAGAPAALRRVSIQEKTKVADYLVIDDLAGLVSLVQIGILEIHTWNSRAGRLEEPDRLVFDLDPAPGLAWRRVIEAAGRVRAWLREDGLESFVKTTGGKGLHVVAPLSPGAAWDACGAYARVVADGIVREEPGAYTANMSKAARPGKVFIDYLRNLRGATSVAAYSPRAREAAPVATPLDWNELKESLRPDRFTILSVPRRLAGLRADPWRPYSTLRQALPRGAATRR